MREITKNHGLTIRIISVLVICALLSNNFAWAGSGSINQEPKKEYKLAPESFFAGENVKDRHKGDMSAEVNWSGYVKVVEKRPKSDGSEIQFIGEKHRGITFVQDVLYKGRVYAAKYINSVGFQPQVESYIMRPAEILVCLNERKDVNGICKPVHFLKLEDGRILMLFEKFPEGQTLKEWLKRNKGKISYAEAVKMMLKLAGIVQKIHNAGVYHWDLRPNNIWITDEGEVIIFDFDFAFSTAEEFVKRELFTFCDPKYVSINRVPWSMKYFCRDAEELLQVFTPAADEVFSLGMILARIFGANEMEVDEAPYEYIPKVLAEFKSNLPVELYVVMEKAISGGRSAYKSMDAFVCDLMHANINIDEKEGKADQMAEKKNVLGGGRWPWLSNFLKRYTYKPWVQVFIEQMFLGLGIVAYYTGFRYAAFTVLVIFIGFHYAHLMWEEPDLWNVPRFKDIFAVACVNLISLCVLLHGGWNFMPLVLIVTYMFHWEYNLNSMTNVKWEEIQRYSNEDSDEEGFIKILPRKYGWASSVMKVVYKGETFMMKFKEDKGDEENMLVPQAKNIAYLTQLGVNGISKARYFVKLPDGRRAILFEEMPDGRTLESMMRARDCLPEEEALDIIIKVSEIIKDMHSAGVYHWDIHPGNIWITNEGDVVIHDFDSAFASAAEFKERELHRYGNTFFMDKCRLDAAASREVKRIGWNFASSEVYAVAKVLLYMIYDAKRMDSEGLIMDYLLNQYINGGLADSDDRQKLSESMKRVLVKALYGKESRYKNIRDFLRDLKRCKPENSDKSKKDKPAGTAISKFIGIPVMPERMIEIISRAAIETVSEDELKNIGVCIDGVFDAEDRFLLPYELKSMIVFKIADLIQRSETLMPLVNDIEDRKRKSQILFELFLLQSAILGMDLPLEIGLKEVKFRFNELAEQNGFKLFEPEKDEDKDYFASSSDQNTSALLLDTNDCFIYKMVWDHFGSLRDVEMSNRLKAAMLMHEVVERMMIERGYPRLVTHFIAELFERYILGQDVELNEESYLDLELKRVFGNGDELKEESDTKGKQWFAGRIGKMLSEFAATQPIHIIEEAKHRCMPPYSIGILELRRKLVNPKVRELMDITDTESYFLIYLLIDVYAGKGARYVELARLIGEFDRDKYEFPALLNLYIDKLLKEDNARYDDEDDAEIDIDRGVPEKIGFLRVERNRNREAESFVEKVPIALPELLTVPIEDEDSEVHLHFISKNIVENIVKAVNKGPGGAGGKMDAERLFASVKAVLFNMHNKDPEVFNELYLRIMGTDVLTLNFVYSSSKMRNLFVYNSREGMIGINMDAIIDFAKESPETAETLIAAGLFGHIFCGCSTGRINVFRKWLKLYGDMEEYTDEPGDILNVLDSDNILMLLSRYRIDAAEFLYLIGKIAGRADRLQDVVVEYMKSRNNHIFSSAPGSYKFGDVLAANIERAIKGIKVPLPEVGTIEINVPAGDFLREKDFFSLAQTLCKKIVMLHFEREARMYMLDRLKDGIAYGLFFAVLRARLSGRQGERMSFSWGIELDELAIKINYPVSLSGEFDITREMDAKISRALGPYDLSVSYDEERGHEALTIRCDIPDENTIEAYNKMKDMASAADDIARTRMDSGLDINRSI